MGRHRFTFCVFKQHMWGLFEKVKCPILVMCARDDVLWPYVHYIHEIVSLIVLIHAGTQLMCERRPEVRFEEVVGGDFETGRPGAFGKVTEFHFDFLEKIWGILDYI
jgi:hypothetical protein